MPRARRRTRSRQGTVRKLASGRWQARFTTPDGDRVALGTYETETAAWAAIDARATDTNRGVWTSSAASRVTLLTVWDDFVEHNTTDSGAVERQRHAFREGFLTGTAKAAIDKRRKPLGEYPIEEITVGVVRGWVRDLLREPLAPSTIDTQWGNLRRVLDWAVEERRIPDNPCKGAAPIPANVRRAQQRHPHFLTLSEMCRLTMAARPGHGLLVEALLWSGMRHGEIRALDGSDVQREAGLVCVDESATQDQANRSTIRLKSTKTARSERRVPMPRLIVDGLAQRDNGPGVPLFPAARGGHMDERRIDEVWRATRTRAGLVGDPRDPARGRRRPPTMHDCRKTVTSLLFALGASVPEVLSWVGHSDSDVTLSVYATVQDWDSIDPVILKVKAMGLSLPDAWNRLYLEAWLAYGDIDLFEAVETPRDEVAAMLSTVPVSGALGHVRAHGANLRVVREA